jgi:hypothetical protein
MAIEMMKLLQFYSALGLKVYPYLNSNKTNLTRHFFKDATSEFK